MTEKQLLQGDQRQPTPSQLNSECARSIHHTSKTHTKQVTYDLFLGAGGWVPSLDED
jgi:hypothetical protein